MNSRTTAKQTEKDLEISVNKELITPQKARRYLETNKNRNPKKHEIHRFKRLLINGEWRISPDAIHIDRNGVLRNGQNRLTAVAESGVSAWFIVERGGDGDAIQRITDDGVKRTAADTLTISDVPNATLVAGATRIVWRYVQTGDPRPQGGSLSASNDELFELYRKHSQISNSVIFARAYQARGGDLIPLSVVAGLHYLMSSGHPEDANDFFTRLIVGSDLEEGEPILVLRNALIKRKIQTGRALSQELLIPWLVRCWSDQMRGRQLKLWSTTTKAPPVYGCAIEME